MNKKLVFIILVFGLTSCGYDYTVYNTVDQKMIPELKQKMESDSTLYKVIKYEDDIYIINAKTELVESKIREKDDAIITIFILAIFLVFIILIAALPV